MSTVDQQWKGWAVSSSWMSTSVRIYPGPNMLIHLQSGHDSSFVSLGVWGDLVCHQRHRQISTDLPWRALHHCLVRRATAQDWKKLQKVGNSDSSIMAQASPAQRTASKGNDSKRHWSLWIPIIQDIPCSHCYYQGEGTTTWRHTYTTFQE